RRYAESGTLEGNEASRTCRFAAPRHQRAIAFPVTPASNYVEPLTDSALRRGALAVVSVRRARGGGLRRFARNRSLSCVRLCRTRDHVRRQVVMDIAAAASYSLAAGLGSSTQSWSPARISFSICIGITRR